MRNLLKWFKLLAALTVCFGASCASEKKVTNSKRASTTGLDKYNSNYSYKKDENGLMRATSNKKSGYANRASYSGASRDFSGQDYTTAKYRKNRWGKKSEYAKKGFGNKSENTDFNYSTYYANKKSDIAKNSNMRKRFAANYGLYGDRTKASERKKGYIQTGSNSYAENQGSYREPIIMSKKQYTQMTVEESKSLLGRKR